VYTTGLLLKLENKFLVNLLLGTYIYPNSFAWYEDKRNTKQERILKEAVVTLSMYFTGIRVVKQRNHKNASVVQYQA